MATNFKLKYLLIADEKGFTSGLQKADKNLKRHEGQIKKQGAAYSDLAKRQRLLDAKAREYAFTLGTQSNRFKKAAQAAADYRSQIKKTNLEIDKQIGLSNKGGVGLKGGVGGSIVGVAVKRILPLMAIGAAGAVISKAGKSLLDFEEKISQVSAISGKSGAELDNMAESAKRVASVTPKTATEVANLQVELLKLGFSADEALLSMRSVIDLSVAGFNDLGETTTLVAQSLNSFSLSAGYSRDIADTFAHAISNSALDLNKLATGLPNVSTAAAKFGWSIQRTTGLLGILADAGIDASKMGTDLRMIITQLTAKGLTLDEGLKKINNSTNKVSTAQELFGQRAFVSALALADQSEKIKELDDEYSKISGTAEEMAAIMQDNVRGSLLKVASAWETLVLNMANGGGIIKNILNGLALTINDINIALGGLDQTRIDIMASSLRKMGEEAVNSWDNQRVGIQRFLDDFLKLEKARVESDLNFYLDEDDAPKDVVRKLKEQLEAINTVIAEYEGKLDVPVDVNVSGGGEGADGDEGRESDLKKISRIEGENSAVRDLRAEYTRLFQQQQLLQGIFGQSTPEIDSYMNQTKDLIDGYEELGASADDFTLKVRDMNQALTEQAIVIGDWKDVWSDLGTGALSVAIDEFAAEIDRAAKAGEKFNWDNFGQGMLVGIGNFLIDFGKGLVQASILAIAAEALVSNPLTAPAGLIVGAAAIAAGMALLAGQKSTGAGQSPASTISSAFGGFGAGEGYSQYAAVDGTRGGSASGSGSNFGSVEFRVRGEDLVAVLNKQSVKSNNMY